MSEFLMSIGGEAVGSKESFGVINPATGDVFEHAPECTSEQLDLAFASAHQAYESWRRDEGLRRTALSAVADTLMESVGDIAAVVTNEQGKPLSDAKFEVMGAALWCRYFANLAIESEVVQDDDSALVHVVRRPLGVVAAITPWNYPLLLAFWKIAPALLAGNTVVIKPSPFTPLSTLLVAQLLQSALPPGVLSAVSGSDLLGAQMTSHPVPRKVSFTGSVETGKKVALAAAPDLKRITLELGGNDPAIVLEDADPAVVGKAIFTGAFSNNGQICSAIKRVYVPASIHDEVVDVLAACASSIKVGEGTDPHSRLGPINNRPQFDRVKSLVADALSSGATTVAGGRAIDRPGYFLEPTILAGVSDGTRIVDEEQFGPALPVVKYHALDEAIAAANATNFGLSGSVWGSDVDHASAVASQLECGTVWVNTHLGLAPNQPFGGCKWSGLGVENGKWGLAEFTQVQSLYRSRRTDGTNPVMGLLVK